MVNILSWAQDQFGESLCIDLVLGYKDQSLYWWMNEWMLAKKKSLWSLKFEPVLGWYIGQPLVSILVWTMISNTIPVWYQKFWYSSLYHYTLTTNIEIFVEYWYHFLKYQYNTQHHTFALLFPLVSISSGMHTSVWKIRLNTCFFFPWRLCFLWIFGTTQGGSCCSVCVHSFKICVMGLWAFQLLILFCVFQTFDLPGTSFSYVEILIWRD
jgi:hypothetical protein